jgi:hypothetical protein
VTGTGTALVRPWSFDTDGWARGDATRALGALRVTNFPTHDTQEGWVFELEQAHGSESPLPRAGVVLPVATHQRPNGLVWVFPDGSALALRRTDDAFFLPAWPLVADRWTPGNVDVALGPGWVGAPAAEDTEAWWTANPDALDGVTPWCPPVTVPPTLWRQRTDALLACLALLADRWPGTQMAQLAKADLSYTRTYQSHTWRMDIQPTLHSSALPFDAWAMAKQPWDFHAARTALEGVVHALFPGRMGFASSSLPGNSLHRQIVPQPFLVLPRRDLPALTAHTRLSAYDTVVRSGAWDRVAPFLQA